MSLYHIPLSFAFLPYSQKSIKIHPFFFYHLKIFLVQRLVPWGLLIVNHFSFFRLPNSASLGIRAERFYFWLISPWKPSSFTLKDSYFDPLKNLHFLVSLLILLVHKEPLEKQTKYHLDLHKNSLPKNYKKKGAWNQLQSTRAHPNNPWRSPPLTFSSETLLIH